jgi:hypothetical protein
MLASILKLRKLFALATIVNYKRREAGEERFPCSSLHMPDLRQLYASLQRLGLPEPATVYDSSFTAFTSRTGNLRCVQPH